MTSQQARVELDVTGAVAVIRLVNPPLNPLTNAMRTQLREVAEDLAGRDEVRAVVITSGSARAFSVGSDIKSFPRDAVAGRAVSEQEHAAYAALERLPQPLVAVLRGHTLGGGLELSLTADIRVAEEGVVLGFPETKIGVFASGGGTQRLPAIIGAGRASMMLLSGEPIDAATALAWGLVNRLTPVGGGERAALEIAESLATLPRLAIRATKFCIGEGLRAGRAAGAEAEIAGIADVYASSDAQEGAAAFAQKRSPVFTHR